MGYTFTWKDIEKRCRKLGMERQGKSSVAGLALAQAEN